MRNEHKQLLINCSKRREEKEEDLRSRNRYCRYSFKYQSYPKQVETASHAVTSRQNPDLQKRKKNEKKRNNNNTASQIEKRINMRRTDRDKKNAEHHWER